MLNEKIIQKIEKKLDTLSNSLTYEIEALAECKSIVYLVQYLILLKDSAEEN